MFEVEFGVGEMKGEETGKVSTVVGLGSDMSWMELCQDVSRCGV